MKACLITDEISSDPETAIELGVAWGVHDFELRGCFSDRVPRMSAYQQQCLRDTLSAYQARVIAIGPGIFKIPLPATRPPRASLGWLDRAFFETWAESQRLMQQHLQELLPASLDFANSLGAHLVIIFGFDRAGALPGEPPEEVLNCLRLAAERAQAAGLQLVLENEDGFWPDTGERLAKVIQAVNHPVLAANWDPANAFFAGDLPYPAGYSAVRGLVRHVHFKDACLAAGGTLQYAVEGQIDWAGQIQALAADGYDGYLSVETHMRPKVSAARQSLERLQALIRAAQCGPPHEELPGGRALPA